MKIGIDIRNIGRKRTGDEVVFLNLVRNLASIDSKNEYILLTDKRTEDELQIIRDTLGIEGKENFRIITLPSENKFDWNIWFLPKFLRESDIDVYHTQYITPFFVPKRIKIITHIHDVSFCVFPQYIHWKDRMFLKMLIPLSLRRADKIIAVSEFTKNEIIAYYQVLTEKISVVYNAISADFEREGEVSSDISNQNTLDGLWKKYALPEKFVLYVGTLQPRKNIPALIRAFSLVAEKVSDISLVLVGNRAGHNFDHEIDEAMDDSSFKDRVIFPGYVEQGDLPKIMRAATVFCFPSLYEGFGVPLVEAMSQKTPIVASDIPCLREIGADAAVYVNTKDLAEFGDVLYNTITQSDIREKLTRAGVERAHFFSWNKSARQLLRIYESFC